MPRVKNFKILIVDDHQLISKYMAHLLSLEPDLEVIATASDGNAALAILEKEEIDLILMDINLPGTNGIDLSHQILTVWPEMKIVILTMESSALYIKKAFEVGVKGFIQKTDDPEMIIPAIRTVLEGNAHLSTDANKAMLKSLSERSQTQAPINSDTAKQLQLTEAVENGLTRSKLTPREMEILNLLVDGKTSKQMAKILSISPNTCDAHRANILAKTNTNSTAGLIKFAIQNKLIDI